MGSYMDLYKGDTTKSMSFTDVFVPGQGYTWIPYNAYVFANDGEATSALYAFEIDTNTGETKQLRPEEVVEFTADFTGFDITGDSERSVLINVKPYYPTGKYIFDFYPASGALGNADLTDEQFVTTYLAVKGDEYELRTGDLSYKLSMKPSASGSWEPYIAFMFGYDGELTTKVYVFEVDPANGTVRQIRGPQE